MVPVARWLLMLMTVVLPLRLLAAAALPIAGLPGHAHAATATQHDHRVAAGSHHDHGAAGAGAAAVGTACLAFLAQVDAPADGAHEHHCPHLAMAGIGASAPSLPAVVAPRVPLPADAPSFVSVVTVVPSPPPTARA